MKECPFCGSDEIQTRCEKRIGKPVEVNGMKFWYTECLDCGCRTRNCFDDDAEFFGYKEGKELSIAMWDTRKEK